jgi:hypothetical protein
LRDSLPVLFFLLLTHVQPNRLKQAFMPRAREMIVQQLLRNSKQQCSVSGKRFIHRLREAASRMRAQQLTCRGKLGNGMNIKEYPESACKTDKTPRLHKRGNLMPMKKIAISLPEPVLDIVDQIAIRRGESRSRVIADILSRVTRAKRDRDITAQIDALFADETLVKEQKHTADEFLRMNPWAHEEW